jgi:FAD-dependent urate hydroxylase
VSAGDDRVPITGGGIGGLSAALALSQRGIPVSVFEKDTAASPYGGAIQIWINAVVGYQQLGILDRLKAVGTEVERQIFRSARDRTLIMVPLGEYANRYGLPKPLMVTRPDLLRTLEESLPAGTVHRSTEVVSFDQDREGVTLRVGDGSEERGSVLVGADGIDSMTRLSLFPNSQPTFQGYQYLRCLARHDNFPAGDFIFTWGRGDRFGAHDAPGGTVYWFGVIRAEQGSGNGRKDQLRQRFRGFPWPVTDLIDEADDSAILRTDIRDIDPLASWTTGRVTLLGDAAHAMTPNLGRGAGEGIEDAVVLAGTLADRGLTSEALAAYDARRRPANAPLQHRSRELGELAGRSNPVVVTVREFVMARIAGPKMKQATEREYADARGSLS